MPNHTSCPTCGGEVWNNAGLNAKRANEGKKPMPLFACKDKNGCGWVEWPPKGAKPQGGQQGRGGPRPPARPLAPLYLQCLTVAKQSWDKVMGAGNYSDAVLQAAAATIFIGARDGAPILAPKPEPRPVEPQEADDDSRDESSIPF